MDYDMDRRHEDLDEYLEILNDRDRDDYDPFEYLYDGVLDEESYYGNLDRWEWEMVRASRKRKRSKPKVD